MKAILFIMVIALLADNGIAQHVELKQGNQIEVGQASLEIQKLNFSQTSPSGKTKAPEGKQYAMVSLQLYQLESLVELASNCFYLSNGSGQLYDQPGAWGEMEVMGSKSKFELSQGATQYIREQGEVLNLIFTIPQSISANSLVLAYDANCSVSEASAAIPSDCSVESFKLFEFVGQRPEFKERFYANAFDKEYTRYLGAEVCFKNHNFPNQIVEHEIQFRWYDANGNHEGSQEGHLRIEEDWKSGCYSTNGWGWEEPGNWSVGDYRVEVYLDRKLVQKKPFTIRQKEYEVEDIKVFSYAGSKPNKPNRNYCKHINADSVTHLSVEVNFNNLAFQVKDQEHAIKLKWYGKDGYEGQQEGAVNIKPDWKTAYYTSNGWGYNELGMWLDGLYRVEVYLDNQLIGEQSVEFIKDEPVRYHVESLGERKVIQMTYASMNNGFGPDFVPVFDLYNSGLLCCKDNEIIVIENKSREAKPQWSDFHGKYLIDVDGAMKEFGSTKYEIIEEHAQTSFRMYGFQRKGEGEHLVGMGVADPGTIYLKDEEGNARRLGEFKWEHVKGSDGVTRSVKTTRLSNYGPQWIYWDGKQIMSLIGGIQKQIGWASWRTIKLPDDSKQTILMTKTLDSQAKWIGRFDGKLYACE